MGQDKQLDEKNLKQVKFCSVFQRKLSKLETRQVPGTKSAFFFTWTRHELLQLGYRQSAQFLQLSLGQLRMLRVFLLQVHVLVQLELLRGLRQLLLVLELDRLLGVGSSLDLLDLLRLQTKQD